MKPSSQCAFVLLSVLALLPHPVQAQYRQPAPPRSISARREFVRSAHAFAAQERQRSTLRLAAGGMSAGVLGLFIGPGIGAAIGSDQDEDENGQPWVDAAWGAAVGGVIGESIGLATGVYLANDQQGSLLLDLVGSLVIGGVGFAVLAENQDPPLAPILMLVTPLAQLGVTVAIERGTAR